MERDAKSATDIRERLVVRSQTPEIIAPRESRIDIKFLARFNIPKERGFLEGQIDFGGIERLEARDFVAPGTELTETFFQRRQGCEKIGNNYDQPAFLDQFRNAPQRCFNIRSGSGALLLQRQHELA